MNLNIEEHKYVQEDDAIHDSLIQIRINGCEKNRICDRTEI
jgi:hypothetical protein